MCYVRDMVDLNWHVPVTEEVAVDAETLAAIDRGIKDADEGRTASLEEVFKMIPQWISKFESQRPR
jgi:predicted transcriptional regulator